MSKTVSNPDSPDRCQGVGAHGGQCWNERTDGSDYCTFHASKSEDPAAIKRQWLLEQFEKRARFSSQASEAIQLLEENHVAINAMIAARLALIVDPGSLIANSAPLSQLLQTSEKIASSLIKLKRENDQLLAKEALIKWGQKIAMAVSAKLEGKFDGWEDAILELSDDIAKTIAEASNKEPEDE